MTEIGKMKYVDMLMHYDDDEMSLIILKSIKKQEKDTIDLLRAAFKLGFSPDHKSRSGAPFFHAIVETSNLKCIMEFIRQGVSLHLDEYKTSIMHICAKNNNYQLIKYLIKKIDIELQDKKEMTALSYAALFENYETMDFLIDAGAKIPYYENGNIGVVDFLLQHIRRYAREKTTPPKKLEQILKKLAIYKLKISDFDDLTMSKRSDVELNTDSDIVQDSEEVEIDLEEAERIANYGYDSSHDSDDEHNHDSDENLESDSETCSDGETMCECCKKHKNDLLFTLKTCIDHWNNNSTIIQILIDLYPNIVNYMCDEYKNTLFLHIAHKNINPLIEICLNTNVVNYDIKNKFDDSCIHILADHCNTKYIERISRNMKDLSALLSDEKRTPIDQVLLSYNKYKKTDLEAIETIDCLVLKGVNLDNENIYKFHTMGTAIQHASALVIDHMAKLGANLNFLNNDVDPFTPLFAHDYVSYAAQLGELDKMIALINNGARIRITQEDKMPTFLLVAITYSKPNIIKYALKMDQVKPYLTVENNKKLLNICIKEGCTNLEILELFGSKEIISKLELDDNIILTQYYDNFISKFFDSYPTVRPYVLTGLKHIANFILKVNSLKCKKDIFDLFLMLDELYEYAGSIEKCNSINKLISIMANRINFRDCQLFSNYFSIVAHVQNMHETDSITISEIRRNILNNISLLDSNVKKTVVTFAAAMTKLLSNQVKDELVKPLEILNGDKVEKIKHLLFKLSWPTKVEHYDEMYKRLILNKGSYKKTQTQLVFETINDKHTIKCEVLLFPNSKQLKKPTTWFKFYAQNIGKKQDDNHMFSFLMDSELENIPCVDRVVLNPKSMYTENSHLLYYFGKLTVDGESTFGAFEYFIDSRHTLFHRMFRPINQCQPLIKKIWLKV
jgi:hypothetical protein